MQQRNKIAPSSKSIFTEGDKKFISISSGGLLAVDFLFIQGYLSLVRLDNPEKFALSCFVISIPFLVTFVVAINMVQDIQSKSFWTRLGTIFVFIFAVIINIIGLIGAFWHFSTDIGNLFIMCIMLAVLLAGAVFFPIHKK